MSLTRTQPPVLFVDDNEALRQTFVVMLRKLGIDVDTADSYTSALTYLEQNKISGLITDDHLGDGRGVDLIEFTLKRYPYALVGIVSGDEPKIPEKLKDRVNILQKPFSQEELVQFLADFPRSARRA